MIDITVKLDVCGLGGMIEEIGRVCIANRGAPAKAKHEDERDYQVWLFKQGNTSHIPQEFARWADCTFWVKHRRSDGIWGLLNKVYGSKAFKEFTRGQKA